MKGSKKETSEVFLNLPGSSDNLRLTDHGTLLVPLASPRSSDWISTTIIDFIVRCRIIRAIMHKVKIFRFLKFICLNKSDKICIILGAKYTNISASYAKLCTCC